MFTILGILCTHLTLQIPRDKWVMNWVWRQEEKYAEGGWQKFRERVLFCTCLERFAQALTKVQVKSCRRKDT